MMIVQTPDDGYTPNILKIFEQTNRNKSIISPNPKSFVPSPETFES